MKLPLTTHATPPSPSTSSIDSTAPYTSSRKRKLDDSVASPDTHSFGEDGGNGQNGRRIRSQPATGPMDEAGMFSTIVRGLANILGWQSAGTAGHPPSEAPVEVSEEQQDNSEASDEDQRVGIHVNADDDHASPTSSRQLKISIPKQEYGGPRRDELAKKKPQAALAPQQLPSPLASEDETPVKSLLGKNPNTKKSQQTSRRPVGQVDDSIRFEAARRPFVPKALSEKAFSQVLEEARKRRDKQQEGIITSPALFHLLHTNLSPQTGTPRRRKTLQSPKSTSMGATFSRLVAWRAPIAAPSPVLRRCEKVTGKITKPSPKKRSWSHKIEQAKSNGKAADEQLKAYMAYIQGEDGVKFLNLKEDQERKRRIDAEIKRLKERGHSEVIPPLTAAQQQTWTKLFRELRQNRSRVYIAKKFGKETLEIATHDLVTLACLDSHGGWLNDNIIYFYLNLIVERENKNGLRVITHNSHFYPKLLKEGYKGVSRWTSRKGCSGPKLLELDYILVPICAGSHWTIGVINCKEKRFEVYDSLSNLPPASVYHNLRKYFDAETKGEANLDTWTDFWQPDAPKQQNGADCGVFAIKTAEVITRGAKPSWNGSVKNMELIRRRICLEIVQGKFLGDEGEE